ncbi:MAG: CarD family transcriptional regulator, partial [Candidatus Paceibacteria bacterium]
MYVNTKTKKGTKEILIAAITPYFLEKGADWFLKNFEKIKIASRKNPFWSKHTLFLKEGAKIKISRLRRCLLEFGYDGIDSVSSPGEFSFKGGFLNIFPINSAHPFRIELLGTYIDRIITLEAPESLKAKRYQIGELESLRPGDFVVHVDHGIGIFRGFSYEKFSDSKLEINGKPGGFCIIEYAPPINGGEPDRLFVPFSQIKKITPYYGFETPRVHRLGGTLWLKTKRRVKEEVIKLAKELLLLYAKRETASRPPYPAYNDMEDALALSFPHIETKDQAEAIQEILSDLSGTKPMDRILVGDVGFGKTEVAIRAAARVVFSGKQVAVLAPTTILA